MAQNVKSRAKGKAAAAAPPGRRKSSEEQIDTNKKIAKLKEVLLTYLFLVTMLAVRCGMIGDAVGQYTPIHAKGAERVHFTFHMIVWPPVAAMTKEGMKMNTIWHQCEKQKGEIGFMINLLVITGAGGMCSAFAQRTTRSKARETFHSVRGESKPMNCSSHTSICGHHGVTSHIAAKGAVWETLSGRWQEVNLPRDHSEVKAAGMTAR